MKLAMPISREATCDICDTEFDLDDALEINSTTTCPCCSLQDRRTHGLDIYSRRNHR